MVEFYFGAIGILSSAVRSAPPRRARPGTAQVPLAPDPPVAEYLQSPRNIKTSGALCQARGNDRFAGPAR